MIAWWMAQLALLGGLLAAAAYGADHALRTRSLPTRWAWVSGLLLTVALGLTAPLRNAEPVAPRVTLPAAPTMRAPAAPVAPHGLLDLLRDAWSSTITGASALVQQGWRAWHAAVPAATERVLLGLWALASVALLCTFAAVHLRYHRRRAQWPAAEVDRTPVRVANDTGPAVIGVLQPQIVVPAWLLERDPHAQSLVMAHEREHVRARDPLLLMLAQAVIVLLPWHPAVWWMAARLRLAVELDCDTRVLRRGTSVRDYGMLLIDLSDRCAPVGAALPAFACTTTDLERRLRAMTAKPTRFTLLRTATTGALASLALLAACEAKLPTSEEVNNASAASVTAAAGRMQLIDTTRITYYINGVVATKEAADKLRAEQIATVNVVRGQTENEVRIVTQDSENGAVLASAGYAKTAAESASMATQFPRKVKMSSDGRPDIVIGTSTKPGVAADPASAFNGLLIVDGAPRPYASMNSIAPDQIVSVNVIKGPAATAKYSDPRAANGVIEIITKTPKP